MPRFRVIDFETTGFPPKAGIVEIGHTDITIGEKTTVEGPFATLHNPGMPIELGAMAVHHIQDKDVANATHPQTKLDNLHADADYMVAHNAAFEMKFYVPPIPMLCTLKIAYRLYPDAPQHTNQVLRYYLGLNDLPEEKCMPAHRAGPDTYTTARVFLEMLKKISATKVPLDELVRWSAEPPHMPRCPIGQHRGKPWAEVDSGFLNWMLKQPTMEADLKFNARRALRERGVMI